MPVQVNNLNATKDKEGGLLLQINTHLWVSLTEDQAVELLQKIADQYYYPGILQGPQYDS